MSRVRKAIAAVRPDARGQRRRCRQIPAPRWPSHSRTGPVGWRPDWSMASGVGQARAERSYSRPTACRPPRCPHPIRKPTARARLASRPMALTFEAARQILQRAIARSAFPAATIEVGDAHQPLWREAFGRLTFDPESSPARDDTIFDLASLTKVVATTALVMRQVERGALGLDDPVEHYIPAWRDEGAVVVTLRDLLAHCSGLPAHVPFFRELAGRQAFEDAIVRTPRAYEPRTTSIYSDLGFMLLGFILESHRDARDTVRHDASADGWYSGSAVQLLRRIWKSRTAPTRLDPWRERLLIGEVDDDNAWALGGAAGHAGLFGAVASVGECARHWLQVLGGSNGRVHAGDRADLRDSSQRRSSEARARSAGTRCWPHHRAARACHRERSVMSVLRGRRCGLIPSGPCTSRF